MPRKSTNPKPKPEPVDWVSMLEEVPEPPKAVRVSTKLTQLADALAVESNIGKTFKLPPKTAGTAITDKMALRGYEVKVSSRAENGGRVNYVTIVGRITAQQ